MNIILSICVPTYNRLDKLKSLLSKLTLIENPAIEILVSDDSTNDDTRNYFSSNNFPNIVYYRNHSNFGQFRNCNACISRAKGEWIQILHDDDDVEISFFEKILPYLNDKELVLITGRSEIVELGRSQGVALAHQRKLDAFGITYDMPMNGIDFKKRILKLGNPIVFSHTIFRRYTAIDHGCFDPNLKFIGDLDFWYKLLESGDVLFLGDKVGRYYIHDSNQLTTIDTFLQQSVELMIARLEAIDFVVNFSGGDDVEEYKLYIKKNIHKTKLHAGMIRNKNQYARFSHVKLNLLLKKFDGSLKAGWTIKQFFLNSAYLVSLLFPDGLFRIYSYLKISGQQINQ